MTLDDMPFLRSVKVKPGPEAALDAYPFSIPTIASIDSLRLDQPVTFFVGDNGSGKSTLLEAIAVRAGMNAEGGSKNVSFDTRASHSELWEHITLVRNARRERTEFFLRAESYFNLGTYVDRIGMTHAYGGVSIHEQSHGESFLALALHRFGPDGLYLLDEPEAALSPQRQLSFLARMHQLVEDGSQFIIATHSPILMAFPGAVIYAFGPEGVAEVEYEETEHFELTRDFLNHRERYLRHLFQEE